VRDIEALIGGRRKQTVACLGLSFKPDIDDMRESPAVEVVRLLAEMPDLSIIVAEPNARSLPHELEGTGVVMMDALSAIDRADIVVLLVDHRQFKLIDAEALKSKALVDTRGLWTWRKARKPDARMQEERPVTVTPMPKIVGRVA
jgi:UDP-N-acetyl-D-mannosaminuronic acid dehydrogenase